MCQTFSTFLFLTFTVLMNLTSPRTSRAAPLTSTRPVFNLVHRDSIHSPYFDKNDNETNRIKRLVESSTARFAYKQKVVREDDFQVPILPDVYGSTFLANISIGQPPVPQLLYMDSGSSLMWVNCLPCNGCSEQLGPVFDPKKSSTYDVIFCYSPYCGYSPGGRCDNLHQCEYLVTYADEEPSIGILSTEQVITETFDKGLVSISDVIFGCGNMYGNFTDHHVSGILGLGFDKISLVSQLGSKFSYCIGSALDRNYIYNKLILGDGAIIEGDSTPLEVVQGLYYVSLEGISVGEKRLDIDSSIFKRNESFYSGVIVDSGTPATWLVKEGHEALVNEVQRILNKRLSPIWLESRRLCYRGKMDADLEGFPIITFHFANDAELVLETFSSFYQMGPELFCFGVHLREDQTYPSLIGLMAQQYYNVGFDINGKTITFQRIDCQFLI